MNSTGERTPSNEARSVLVVDDEPAICQMVAHALRAQRHEVLVADSATTARAVFAEKSDTIRVLVSDVMLGDGNGVDLAKELRQQNPNLRILLMSGFMEEACRYEL